MTTPQRPRSKGFLPRCLGVRISAGTVLTPTLTRQWTHRLSPWRVGEEPRVLPPLSASLSAGLSGTGTWGQSGADVLGVARVWKSPYQNSHIRFSSVPACSCLLGGSRAADAPSKFGRQQPRGGYGGNFSSRLGLILEEALGWVRTHGSA